MYSASLYETVSCTGELYKGSSASRLPPCHLNPNHDVFRILDCWSSTCGWHFRYLCLYMYYSKSRQYLSLTKLQWWILFFYWIVTSSSIQSKFKLTWINNSSKFSIVNTSTSTYYYAAFEINVVVASNYTFTTESYISTNGYIYNNTFNPDDLSLHVLVVNGNSSANGQFKLIVYNNGRESSFGW